jgi:hypothetical protein
VGSLKATCFASSGVTDLRRHQVHLAVDERRQQHFARQRQEIT